jgi:hypothetical protein
MTQKQALINILNSISHPALRRLFICSWLEDINWHSECQLLNDALPESQQNLIEEMESALNKGQTHLANGLPFPFEPYEYRNASERLLPGFVYAFGWGIDSSEWISNGAGTAFVQELEELIKKPERVAA